MSVNIRVHGRSWRAVFTGSVDWRPWTRPANTGSVYRASMGVTVYLLWLVPVCHTPASGYAQIKFIEQN